MELEFDKEIDAILRKTRAGKAASEIKTAHIDADAVAAFAENALPAKTRAVYFEHFADCDRCRKLLAQAAAWPPPEAKSRGVAAAAPAVAVPWYKGIFRLPNLAMAMGALVMVLGGVMAFLVVNRRANERSATVAGVMNNQTRADGVSTAPAEAPSAAMSNSSGMAAANTAANTTVSDTTAAANKPAAAPGGRGPSDDQPSSPASGQSFSVDGSDAPAQPKTAAPPPPATMAQPPAAADERERKDDSDKKEEAPAKGGYDAKMSARSETSTADSVSRDAAPQAMKKAGPNRAVSGPRQTNVQENNLSQNAVGGTVASSIKNAGGKKFENKGGVWYDTAYHGQATKNYRRGSDEYQNLDGGLRSIASTIGGVVVVVWKGAAYRIQ